MRHRTYRYEPEHDNERTVILEVNRRMGGVHLSITDPDELIEDVTINGVEVLTISDGGTE
jgi:hypothetical protein